MMSGHKTLFHWVLVPYLNTLVNSVCIFYYVPTKNLVHLRGSTHLLTFAHLVYQLFKFPKRSKSKSNIVL
jgi:hypothetical protein